MSSRDTKLIIIEDVLAEIAMVEDRDNIKFEDEYIAKRILEALEGAN